MGLFTDKCGQCGYRVRKGSKFCPGCGGGAPKGIVRCGTCNNEVRSSAKFCWSCGSEMAAAPPVIFTSNRWARGPEDFATRIDESDLHGWLIKPLIIEHGTRALFFQGGRFAGELGPGSYDVNGFASRIKNFLINKPASIVLLDAGDLSIDLENGDLWTADQFEVGQQLRLVLQAVEPETLFVNLIKGQNRIALDEFERQLAGEAQMLLRGLVATFKAEQLFTSFDMRYAIEGKLREHLAITLRRFGLELIQLRFIQFEGEGFERLRRERAAGSESEQRLQLAQRLREQMTHEQMHAFKSEKEFQDFVHQTEHELGLKGVIREDELKRLSQRFLFERNREQILRRIELTAIINDAEREQAWKQLLADENAVDEHHQRALGRELATTENQHEKSKIEVEIDRLKFAEQLRQRELRHVQDLAEARGGIDLLKQVQDVKQQRADREQEREARRLAAFSQADAKALIAILDGPAADRLADLERFRAQQAMTPEQLLGIAAAASPDAAKALAAKYEVEGRLPAELLKRVEQQLVEQRQMAEGYADRMERIMQTGLQQMGGVATARAQAGEARQTVVVPGGIGAPVVVNPGAAPPVACAHCGSRLELAGAFCPSCGKK